MGWFDDNGVPEPVMMGRGGQMKQVQPEIRVAQPPATPTNGTVATPAPAAPTPAAPTAQPGQTLEQAIAAYQQANPYSPNAYEGLFDHLKQQGFQVERPTRAGGTKLSDDKIVGPDGKMYDITVGVDGPNPTWAAPQHIPGEYWFNGQRVQRREELSAEDQGWNPNAGGPLSSFGAPGLAAPWTQQFQAPTGTDDPGYAWRVAQGQKGIENSAAAKGTLLTGGTLKDIMDYQTGAALQGYGETWNRAKNLYDTNRGTWWGNQDSAYNKLSGMANTGAKAASDYTSGMDDLYSAMATANANATGVNANNWNNTFGELAKLGGGAYQDWIKKKKAEEAAKRAGQTPPYAPPGTSPAGSGGFGPLDS